MIVAPYAVHDASIVDFAPGHSLAQALAEAGVPYVAATYWKSATYEARHFGIDAYLSDLNVAIDDLGGRVALIGLCQGGWLAALYAARFPGKVEKLVLAGAPVDVEAAPSTITRALANTPTAAIRQAIALGGGLVPGAVSLALWAPGLSDEYRPEIALQVEGDEALKSRFAAWNARGMDLPGAYFLQTAEWLFRENRLADGGFPALGRDCRLADLHLPIFALAAEDDVIAPPPQVAAVARHCVRSTVTVRVAPGRHLSLFMGARTLKNEWREIAHWLSNERPAGKRARPGR